MPKARGSGGKKVRSIDEPEADALDLFLPPVASWFRSRLGAPTLPQRLGWPAIAAGRNTLIVAPTGSGKTLAAFLAGLDLLWRAPRRSPGVQILYISPLKALNEDVRRNLQTPLDGILAESEERDEPLRPLSVAVRSGDTPTSERARIARKPPEVLITTPESLHLMLTCRAREVLRNVSHVIVDEIHAVCGNKRGVFLALLLERLEALGARPFVRIGLSATQRPLDEVARYLGGDRPVTIIDASGRKPIDLQVIWPSGGQAPVLGGPGTIWPAIEDRILELVENHRSTIVFANSRRTVEKLTAKLNELVATDVESAVADEPTAPAFRAHHGSLSLDERRATEEMLKNANLRAVVTTASLELGIDMGEVDLVCQVESPGNVARGLQRVGRSGHLVGGTSKGRFLAKTPADLLETAALARAMLAGDIEPLRVPAQLPGRPRPADRRLRGDGRLGRPRALRPDPPCVSVPRPLGRRLRARALAGLGSVSDRLAPRSPAANRLGSRPQPAGPVARNGPLGPRRRRDDPRPRALSRCIWAKAARASASWTRSSSSNAGSARASCWATAHGGSTRSTSIG